jgi:hypothetical protein
MVSGNCLASLASNSLSKSQDFQEPPKYRTAPPRAKSTSQSQSRNPSSTPMANQSYYSGTVTSITKEFQKTRIGPSADQVESQEEEVSDAANSNGKLSDRKSNFIIFASVHKLTFRKGTKRYLPLPAFSSKGEFSKLCGQSPLATFPRTMAPSSSRQDSAKSPTQRFGILSSSEKCKAAVGASH